jgi:glycine hydroxymethyltransferase
MTTRGLVGKDFELVADFVDRAIQTTKAIHSQVAGRKLKDFKDTLGDGKKFPAVEALRREVVDFARSFPGIAF